MEQYIDFQKKGMSSRLNLFENCHLDSICSRIVTSTEYNEWRGLLVTVTDHSTSLRDDIGPETLLAFNLSDTQNIVFPILAIYG